MDDLPGSREQRDPKVIRLSHQYASCQLILPPYDDPAAAAGHHAGADGRDGVLPLQVARCGLCKRPLDTATLLAKVSTAAGESRPPSCVLSDAFSYLGFAVP